MTKQEIKMIFKIIDLRTVEEDASREIYNKIIRNPEELKKDIQELFGKGGKTND